MVVLIKNNDNNFHGNSQLVENMRLLQYRFFVIKCWPILNRSNPYEYRSYDISINGSPRMRTDARHI